MLPIEYIFIIFHYIWMQPSQARQTADIVYNKHPVHPPPSCLDLIQNMLAAK